MNTFAMHLQSATRYERIEGVVSFVGTDDSGSFGILAGHARAITCLAYGIARFRGAQGPWRYLAAPGGVLHFARNELHFSATHYVLEDDVGRIGAALHQEVTARERRLRGLTASAARLEEQLLRQLWSQGREALGLR
jgi:F-type H+-transporting ATPase subunit epsilon